MFIQLLLLLGLSISVHGQESAVFINPSVPLVNEFEGWGTSLAWWPDILGHMDEEVINAVTSAVFAPDKLNLNIVRYTIGGTTPGNYMCGPYRPGAATESFLDGPEADYDWTRDPRQRDILAKAKALGVDTFEAFSNSPPQWMTISGCSKGNDMGGLLHNNFDAARAEEFADYATEVIKHFHDVWDITFQTYAPFNEPFGLAGLGGWFGEISGQEGCNMARPVMAAVLRSVDAALKAKNMDYVTLTAADETQINTETATQNYFKENGVSNLYTKINVHGYWDVKGNRRDLLSMVSRRDGHKLWMDEMGWAGTPLNDMTQGLIIANRILSDLKKLLPSAWIYWQIVEGNGEWGVIDIPYDNPDATLPDIKYNSGYHSLMQFSKYIRKGYQIVSVNDEKTLAAYNGDSLVLVIVNDLDQAVEHSYSLSLFKSHGAVSATRTSPTEQNENIPDPAITNNQITYTAPAKSITTIEVSGAEYEAKVNVLLNGNFEELGAWRVEPTGNGGVNSASVWNGETSGFLTTGESTVQLIQSVNAPKTGTYYLSAWCSSSGSATKLGVNINGATKELTIAKDVGYDQYALSFEADQNDSIDIYFSSTGENVQSFIDDASLYST